METLNTLLGVISIMLMLIILCAILWVNRKNNKYDYINFVDGISISPMPNKACENIFEKSCKEYIEELKSQINRDCNKFIHEIEGSKNKFQLIPSHKITESLSIIAEKYKHDSKGCIKALDKWCEAVDILNQLHSKE